MWPLPNKTRAIVTLVSLAVGLTLFLPMSACGGSEDKGMSKEEIQALRRRGRKGGRASRAAAAAAGAKQISLKVKNPNWDAVRPYFTKFLEQKHTSPKNVFEPQLLNIIPRPVLEEEEEPDEGEVTEVPDEPEKQRGPLEQHPVKDYSLLVIMSGTTVPKAFVADPKGNAFIVTEDMPLGDKGGIVKAITQYNVIVQEPAADKPIRLSIKPQFVDLASSFDIEEEYGERGPGDVPRAVIEPGSGQLPPIPAEQPQ